MNEGLVKICGVTNTEDAAAAAQLGADLVGINFYPVSPRYVPPEIAPAILAALDGKAEAVAVMVSPARQQLIDEPTALTGFGAVQWHDRDHEPRPWLNFSLIPAFAVQSTLDLTRIAAYIDLCRQAGCLP